MFFVERKIEEIEWHNKIIEQGFHRVPVIEVEPGDIVAEHYIINSYALVKDVRQVLKPGCKRKTTNILLIGYADGREVWTSPHKDFIFKMTPTVKVKKLK